MIYSLRNIRAKLLCALFVIIASGMPGAMLIAQDIHGYTIHAHDDVFQKAFTEELSASTVLQNFPVMECVVEYLRRNNGQDIVYRRGPVALTQQSPMRNLDYLSASGTQPATETDISQKTSFIGGILLDLPKAGETNDVVSSENDMQYMVRVAVVPVAYRHEKLTAKIIIERAIVYTHGGEIDLHNSEVFSRTVQVSGNEPLNFALPAWEVIGGEQELQYVPKSLTEDILITMEIPHYFGFSKNYPDPFIEKTRVSYAVPVESQILLTVQVRGKDIVLDKGTKQPGIHHLVWNANDVPDGVYAVTLVARDQSGAQLHSGQMKLHKSVTGMAYPTRHPNIFSLLPDRMRVSVESGAGYQMPVDNAQPMRNMFTHIGVRIGYQFSEALELGAVIGQEAFHEYPDENVDIDAISDYGGVVGYKYGFGGAYMRYFGHIFGVSSITQISFGLSNKAPLADAGFGIGAELLPQIDLYIIPSVMMHFRDKTSTKVGLQYGIRARF